MENILNKWKRLEKYIYVDWEIKDVKCNNIISDKYIQINKSIDDNIIFSITCWICIEWDISGYKNETINIDRYIKWIREIENGRIIIIEFF